MTQIKASLALVTAVLGLTSLAGCVTPLAPRGRTMELEIAFGPEGSSLLSQRVVRAPGPPALTEHVLEVVTRDARGREVSRSFVQDARGVTYEDPTAAEADRSRSLLTGAAGVVTVHVPAIDGTVELLDADGVVLAHVPVSPSRPPVAPLLSSSDVVGPPALIAGDPSATTRILFLPEGYREDELAQYDALVDQVLVSLRAQTDYGVLWDHFAFYRQDVRSTESGLDRPDAPGVVAPYVQVDTAFDVTLNVGGVARCASFGTSEGSAAVRQLRESAHADVVVLLVNTDAWCGCAPPGVTVNCGHNPLLVAAVVAHELGHSLFGLGDEYVDHQIAAHTDCAADSGWPNVSSSLDPHLIPWGDMLGTDLLPTPDTTENASVVGAFEGAGYCPTQRYRPSHNCLMRDANPLHSAPPAMCPVCRREMERRLGVAVASGGGGAGSTVHDHVRIENHTGAYLWARCAHEAFDESCSAWTLVEDGGSAEVRSYDGRYVLDNQDYLPSAPLHHYTFRADQDVIEVHPDASSPLAAPPDAPTSSTCSDTCFYANDGQCDDGGAGSADSACELGTDCGDCGARDGSAAAPPPSSGPTCDDTCRYASDGVCDDGSTGGYAYCDLGTDCTDCTAGTTTTPPPSSGPTCDDTCLYAGDGVCDDGSTGGYAYCALGTDCTDCAAAAPAPLCEETCFAAGDGECDDGGAGSVTSLCAYGSDCTDCGTR